MTEITCRCGATMLDLSGAPIMTASCHCQSCRDAAAQLATLPGALHISQNGDAVPGTIAITGDGRNIEFTPDSNWQPNALIQVFLDTNARDTSGNAVFNYQGSFRTETDGSSDSPFVIRESLFQQNTNNILTNSFFDIEFSEALDPATVNSANAFLQENFSGGALVPATVSLLGGDTIRIAPNAALSSETNYFYRLLPGLPALWLGVGVYRTEHFNTTAAGVLNPLLGLAPVEVQTGKVAGIGRIPKPEINRISAVIHRCL